MNTPLHRARAPIARAALLLTLALPGCDGSADRGSEPVDVLLDGAPTDAGFDGRPDALPDGTRPPPDTGMSGDGGVPPDAEPFVPPTPLDDYWQPPAPPALDCGDGRLALYDGCGEPWVCPDGWRRHPDGFGCLPPPLPECPPSSVALPDGTCLDPWDCPDGWARPEGDRHCTPLAVACPRGRAVPGGCIEFPACDAPRPEGRLVVAEAPFDGDGTPGAPYRGLQSAITRSPPGTTLLLAPGRYRWPDSQTPHDIRVVGTCPDEVIVEAVRVTDHTVRIERATLADTGEAPQVFAAGISAGDGRLLLQDVVLAGAVGATLSGGTLELDGVEIVSGDNGVVVRDGGAVEGDRIWAAGQALSPIAIFAGGRVDLRRLYVDVLGAQLASEGELRLTDVYLEGRPESFVRVGETGAATLERLSIAGAPGAGQGVISFGELTVRDAHVTGVAGIGIGVLAGQGNLERVAIDTVEALGDPPAAPVCLGVSGEATLTDIDLEGCPHAGLFVNQGGIVRAERLRIEGSRRWPEAEPGGPASRSGADVLVGTGRFEGHRMAWSAAGGIGVGVALGGRATVSVGRGGHLFPDVEPTVVAQSSGEMELSDVWLEGGSAGTATVAPQCVDGRAAPAHLDAERMYLGRGARGLVAIGSTAEVRDLVISGAVGGIHALGGTVEVDRAAFVDAGEFAFSVVGDTTPLSGFEWACALPPPAPSSLTHALVHGQWAQGLAQAYDGELNARAVRVTRSAGGHPMMGLSVQADGRLTLSESRIEQTDGVGVLATGPRATVDLTDVVLDLTEAPLTEEVVDRFGLSGQGMILVQDGTASIERMRVVGARTTAFEVRDSELRATDLHVSDSQVGPDGGNGYGIGMIRSDVAFDRVSMIRNRTVGVLVDASRLEWRDGVIADTASSQGPIASPGGFGLVVDSGSSARIEGLRIANNRGAGALVLQSTVDAERLHITGTRRISTTGHGMEVVGGASVELRDFVIGDNRDVGLLVDASVVRMSRGLIFGNPVGLLFRFAAWLESSGVRFEDNGVDRRCGGGCIELPPPAREDPP